MWSKLQKNKSHPGSLEKFDIYTSSVPDPGPDVCLCGIDSAVNTVWPWDDRKDLNGWMCWASPLITLSKIKHVTAALLSLTPMTLRIIWSVCLCLGAEVALQEVRIVTYTQHQHRNGCYDTGQQINPCVLCFLTDTKQQIRPQRWAKFD